MSFSYLVIIKSMTYRGKEDDIKAAKIEVSGIIKKVRKFETAMDIKAAKDEFTAVFAEMNFILSIQQSHSKMGNPTGEEIGVPAS